MPTTVRCRLEYRQSGSRYRMRDTRPDAQPRRVECRGREFVSTQSNYRQITTHRDSSYKKFSVRTIVDLYLDITHTRMVARYEMT